MSGRKTLARDRRHRKTITTLWVAGLALVVILLIYWEQSAILYILATLGVTALLVSVAVSDLAHTDAPSGQLSQPSDAAAIANATSSTYGNRPSK
jgi:fatty acid desaturase